MNLIGPYNEWWNNLTGSTHCLKYTTKLPISISCCNLLATSIAFCRPTARRIIMPFSSQFHRLSGVILYCRIRLCNLRYHWRCSSIVVVTFARTFSRYWQYLSLILGCRARNRVDHFTPGGVTLVLVFRARRIAIAIDTSIRTVTGKQRSLILPH